MTKQFHPVAELFPLMSGPEFESLKADIAENGLREAVWLHPDGSIIDGRNRYNACTELGIVPEFRTWNGDGSLVAFVVSLNLHRRHLNSGQLAMVALDILPLLEEEAKERQRGGQGGVLLGQKIDQAKNERMPKATQQAAVITGTNRQYVSDAKRIASEAPKLAAQVRAGTVTMAQANQLSKMPEEKREAVQEKMKEMGTDKVTKAARMVTQESRADAPAIPSGKYRVIYADPPWSYGNTMPEGTTQPDDYYPLMSTPTIAALPVKELAEDNSVLFLWTTSPHLEECFDVIRGWGFKYKTSFVWDKIKHNMGHYNSVRHEFLLVCTRGSCTPDVPKLFDSVQSIERTAHSVKPDEFREIIDTIYPHGERVELFARRSVDGWARWGNE
jgi:N6-adenosine-specific RNA methylase IME4